MMFRSKWQLQFAFLVVFCTLAGNFPSYGQSPSSSAIEDALKPPASSKTRSLTRSLSASESRNDADDKVLKSLPVRGLRIEMRDKLDEIVARNDLPKIDIEVNFDYDSDQVKPDSIPTLNELGVALSGRVLGKSRILLNGHTDAAGDESYNQNLSERRAASVRDYLIGKFAIDPHRLIAIGYGEGRLKNGANPLAAENRRVEVINLNVE